jgi:hypothetical protein
MNKEETMLEAAVKYSLTKRDVKSLSNREFDFAKKDFIAGAKWQEERMYSEKDMLKCWNAAYIDALSTDYIKTKPLFFADFIEQFKTKQDETH